MKKMMVPMALFLMLMFASCTRDRHTDGTVVETEGYEPFHILALGDSYCGTISSNLQIQFDCGGLAGTYANEQDGKRDGRCVVARTKGRVAATIGTPPPGQKSKYYPINVFSSNRDVKEDEVKRLAFEIEKVVLRK